jgi:hypothetical protein
MNDKLERIPQEERGLIEALPRHFPGGSEERLSPYFFNININVIIQFMRESIL